MKRRATTASVPLNLVREELARAAKGRKTVTYGHIMKRFGISRGGPLTRLIGEVDRSEYSRGAPGFAAIIVRKDTGYPGGGYFCDDELPKHLRRPRNRSTDPKLSFLEMSHVRKQQRRIWEYYSRR